MKFSTITEEYLQKVASMQWVKADTYRQTHTYWWSQTIGTTNRLVSALVLAVREVCLCVRAFALIVWSWYSGGSILWLGFDLRRQRSASLCVRRYYFNFSLSAQSVSHFRVCFVGLSIIAIYFCQIECSWVFVFVLILKVGLMRMDVYVLNALIFTYNFTPKFVRALLPFL